MMTQLASVEIGGRMTTGFIWDEQTGDHLANIVDGSVFRSPDNKPIGTVRDGAIYGLMNDLICYLAPLGGRTGTVPAKFKKLLLSESA